MREAEKKKKPTENKKESTTITKSHYMTQFIYLSEISFMEPLNVVFPGVITN